MTDRLVSHKPSKPIPIVAKPQSRLSLRERTFFAERKTTLLQTVKGVGIEPTLSSSQGWRIAAILPPMQ